MENKNKAKDPLPKSFATEEEAGQFWDTHSTMDYSQYLEPADIEFKIEKRVFEVQIAEDVFRKLREEAKSSRETIPKVVDQILRKELTLV